MGKLISDVANPLPTSYISSDVIVLPVDAPTTPSLGDLLAVITTPLEWQEWMNKHIVLTRDDEDIWQSPALTYKLRGGDNEDWALLACDALDNNGYDTKLIVVNRFAPDSGYVAESQAICVVELDSGELCGLGSWGFIFTNETTMLGFAEFIYTNWYSYTEYQKTTAKTVISTVLNPDYQEM